MSRESADAQESELVWIASCVRSFARKVACPVLRDCLALALVFHHQLAKLWW